MRNKYNEIISNYDKFYLSLVIYAVLIWLVSFSITTIMFILIYIVSIIYLNIVIDFDNYFTILLVGGSNILIFFILLLLDFRILINISRKIVGLPLIKNGRNK